MTRPDVDLPHVHDERVERRNLRGARGPETGHPRRPPERRRGLAWALPALAVAMLVVGLVLPQGLILAAGLVMAGVAAYVFAPPQGPAARRPHPR
ncbi:hypothetical protein ABZX69_32860 [Streptomyces sp. NPDC004074]|uniref:hypothetical protein n=1 Tax=Streptomyces sp. NPDC004074 TaxID=3154277 RepID=UPI0033B95D4C